jgi:hypothetical protein
MRGHFPPQEGRMIRDSSNETPTLTEATGSAGLNFPDGPNPDSGSPAARNSHELRIDLRRKAA